MCTINICVDQINQTTKRARTTEPENNDIQMTDIASANSVVYNADMSEISPLFEEYDDECLVENGKFQFF